MPPRIGSEQQLERVFIREWRERANLSQDRLVDRVRERIETFSKSSLSRVENGRQPYSQPILEAIAWALSCESADLLKPIPRPETDLEKYVRSLNEAEQERALQLLRLALSGRREEAA